MERLTAVLQRLAELPLSIKLGVAALILVLLTAVNFLLFIQPVVDETTSLRAQLAAANVSLAEKQAIADNLNDKRREMDALDFRLQEALTQLPEQKDVAELLAQLNEVGRRSGLEIASVVPGTEVPKSFYAEIPIAVSVAGNFHEVAAFLQEVARLRRIVNVTNLKLGSPSQPADKVVLKGDFVATTFRFVQAKPATATKGTP